MKNFIVFCCFCIIFTPIYGEIEVPEFIHSLDTISPEKRFEQREEQTRIEERLREKAKENYKDSLLLTKFRREKYLKNAQDLSDRTRSMLVNPELHEYSSKADIDRLTQEIAREKKRSNKLWFNSEKSGTLINDLQDLKMKLQKKQIDKILQERQLKSVNSSELEKSVSNVDKTTTEPFKPALSKSSDIGSKLEDNPLKPKQNFDYDAWKKELENKKSKIEDEQKEINKNIAKLKKQEDYQNGQLSGIEYQKNEILKQYPSRTFKSEHIDYISTEIVKNQAEARRIEEERLKDFKFTTFGIHDDNEKLQELKKEIGTWKDELDAYDRLQALEEREKTITAKISDLKKQQQEHLDTLKKIEDPLHEINSSIDNANFHLKRIDKYLNAL